MNRPLLRTEPFVRAIKKYIRKHPDRALEIQQAFEQLAADAFHPGLKTHKLKGKLEECYAFRLKGGFRVLFEYLDSETVNLLDIGPHDIYR